MAVSQLQGYASVFDTDYEVYDAYGPFNERIARGAFAKTLAAKPSVVLNIGHGTGGTGMPLARTENGSLRLAEDLRGLSVVADLNPKDPDVKALAMKMTSGLLSDMSFAFRVTDQEWDEECENRTIRSVDLHQGDVSVVTYGANPATSSTMRSAAGNTTRRAEVGPTRRGAPAPMHAMTRIELRAELSGGLIVIRAAERPSHRRVRSGRSVTPDSTARARRRMAALSGDERVPYQGRRTVVPDGTRDARRRLAALQGRRP